MIPAVGRISSITSDAIKIDLYNRDGSYKGTLSVSTSRTRASASKKTGGTGSRKFKKLRYNFKRLSNQIMRTKTSANAKQMVTKAKFQIADLRMKLTSGEYDYSEVHSALVHAEKIARVAKKHLKNLQQEENIEKNGKAGMTDPEELKQLEEENEENAENEIPDTSGMTEEELQQLAEELQEEMERIEDEMEEMEESMLADDLLQQMMQTDTAEMEPEDLEALKKKHRSDEMRDIMKADMEYLKALFDRMAKEKEAASNGSAGSSGSSDNSSGSGAADLGISLELGGVDMPVETAAAPVETAGANVDVTA